MSIVQDNRVLELTPGDMVRVIGGRLFWHDSIGQLTHEFDQRDDQTYWRVEFAFGESDWFLLTELQFASRPAEANVITEGDDHMLDWSNIKPGDILTHKQSGDGYIVTDKISNGHQVVLIRTLIASNPREWDLYHDPT